MVSEASRFAFIYNYRPRGTRCGWISFKKLTRPAGVPVRVADAPEDVDSAFVREVRDVEKHEVPLGRDDLRLVIRRGRFQAGIGGVRRPQRRLADGGIDPAQRLQ